MIRINLLPHRAEMRAERRKQFYTLAGGMFAIGALVVILGQTILSGYVEHQERRNDFLKENIQKLDAEIQEIQTLREQIDALLARKQVIESLQVSRSETVQILNELAARMPTGAYLRTIKQTGKKVVLNGHAQSSARVSTLMRNLGESSIFEQPNLIEVKAVVVGGRAMYEFTLQVMIKGVSAVEGDNASTRNSRGG